MITIKDLYNYAVNANVNLLGSDYLGSDLNDTINISFFPHRQKRE